MFRKWVIFCTSILYELSAPSSTVVGAHNSVYFNALSRLEGDIRRDWGPGAMSYM